MADDPFTYDLTEFAREFTWAVIYWNNAEMKARQLLSGLLGAHEATLALVADLGARTLKDALLSTARGMESPTLADHVRHFAQGYERMADYRNLYVHGLLVPLVAPGQEHMTTGTKKLQGHIMTVAGKGRLKSINQPLTIKQLSDFGRHCKALMRYGEAISREVGLTDDAIDELLETLPPSLQKPAWPAPPARNLQYIQE